MAKYIVEIPDEIKVSEDLVPFDMCRPSWWDETYKKGLNDAWEAARKICGVPADGSLTLGGAQDIFGTIVVSEIFKRNTPFEAISKIREYEEKKKAEDEIKVGDEVIIRDEPTFRYVVLHSAGNIFSGMASGFDRNGAWGTFEKKRARKTGRHFPQIVEVLERMKGE